MPADPGPPAARGGRGFLPAHPLSPHARGRPIWTTEALFPGYLFARFEYLTRRPPINALAGGKLLLTDDEIKATLTKLQTELRARQEVSMQKAGDINKKAGDDFLAQNKTKEGVVALPDGLQYKILKQGNGPKPAATDSVVCNYRGTLLDGTEFDSSYKRGQPATFPVNGVIKGWTEAVQLMPVGSKWQLFIPADLAYGNRGAGADIGPNATLIFEVELLSIQNKAAAQVPPNPQAPPK